MNFWVSLVVILLAGIVSSLVTYLVTRLRTDRGAEERSRTLAVAIATLEKALENEKANFAQATRGIEENARRRALDEFLADLHVEERHYIREHRVLFAHRKSLVLEERMFFRNIPISSWVEHEIPVEEGADLDAVAKTLSVFGQIEAAMNAPRSAPLLFHTS
jgi:hypothetical protein